MDYDPAHPANSPPIMPSVPGISSETEFVVAPLARSTGWLKFLGVMSIIGGVLTALTCYGIVIAWLPIWLGVLQWQAGDRLSVGYAANDTNTLAYGTDKLRLAFKIQGITLICVMGLYVILFLVFGVALIAGALQTAGGT